MKSIKAPSYSWLYFENPDKDDLGALQEIFKLHPVVLGEFSSPTYRPRVAKYKNYVFMVLHFPVYNQEEQVTELGEVDILMNDKYLVTNCTKHQLALDQYFKERSQQQGSPVSKMPKNPYLLLFKLIDLMLNACFPMLDHITDNLEEIEKQIFHGHEKSMVKEISIVKRDIINFRRIIQSQRSILNSLAERKAFTGNLDYRVRVSDIIGTHIRVWNMLENQKETTDSLEATNDSLFSYKLNETIKTLTIFSVIMLPASLTAGIFGMNVKTPIHNFWIIIGLVVVMMLAMFLFVKRKKWL